MSGSANSAGAPPAGSSPSSGVLTVVAGTGTLAEAVARFGPLLYPRSPAQAWHRPLAEPLIAVTALRGGAPVGVLLADREPGTARADIRTLYVAPAERRRGIASALVARAELEVARRGARDLLLAVRTDWPLHGAALAIAAARGWEEARTVRHLVKCDTEAMRGAAWLDAANLPLADGYETFPWTDLTEADRRAMRDEQARSPWFPPVLSPFQMEDRIDPNFSIGLRRGAEVAGWVIGHRMRADVVQYTTVFTRAGVPRAHVVRLMALASQRQIAAGVPTAIFTIEADNAAALAFVRKRLAPHRIAHVEVRIARHRLP